MREANNHTLLVLMVITIAAALTTLTLLGGRTSITGLHSGVTNVSVIRLAAIDALVAIVEFGDMVQDATNETSNYDPHPFVVKNNGTTFLNITICSEDLWAAAPNPAMYYRVNASDDNATNTAQSTQLGWVTPWIDMPALGGGPPCPSPATDNNLATCINNSPNANSINVHINITVPTLASAGTHTVTVTFQGTDPGAGVCGAGT